MNIYQMLIADETTSRSLYVHHYWLVPQTFTVLDEIMEEEAVQTALKERFYETNLIL